MLRISSICLPWYGHHLGLHGNNVCHLLVQHYQSILQSPIAHQNLSSGSNIVSRNQWFQGQIIRQYLCRKTSTPMMDSNLYKTKSTLYGWKLLSKHGNFTRSALLKIADFLAKHRTLAKGRHGHCNIGASLHLIADIWHVVSNTTIIFCLKII